MRYLLLLILVVGCSPEPEPDPEPENELDPRGFDFEPAGIDSPPWLLHVNARSDDDVWVVGGEPTAGVIYHGSVDEFDAVDIPETPLLNWIHLLDGSEIAVGNGGTILRNSGNGFELEETPTEEDLWGVWGASADDVWAVGGRGREAGQATILRYDGMMWNEVEIELSRPNVNAFFKVWGSAADDVYIVGQRGAVLHWDGSDLNEEGVGTGEDLISVHGTSKDNVFIVGGRGNGLVAQKNATEWSLHELAPAPGVNGVFVTDDGVAWVSGNRGLIGRFIDGDFAQAEPPTSQDFHALYLSKAAGLIAVGGTFANTAGPYNGIAAKHEGFTP